MLSPNKWTIISITLQYLVFLIIWLTLTICKHQIWIPSPGGWMNLGPKSLIQWICKKWIGKLGFNELDDKYNRFRRQKKRKINWFKLKKIILGTVRGDLFLYISFKCDYKVNSWWLQCFSLNFRSLLFSRVSYIIYLLFYDLCPLVVDHSGHYLSACPIGHPLWPSMSWDN